MTLGLLVCGPDWDHRLDTALHHLRRLNRGNIVSTQNILRQLGHHNRHNGFNSAMINQSMRSRGYRVYRNTQRTTLWVLPGRDRGRIT